MQTTPSSTGRKLKPRRFLKLLLREVGPQTSPFRHIYLHCLSRLNWTIPTTTSMARITAIPAKFRRSTLRLSNNTPDLCPFKISLPWSWTKLFSKMKQKMLKTTPVKYPAQKKMTSLPTVRLCIRNPKSPSLQTVNNNLAASPPRIWTTLSKKKSKFAIGPRNHALLATPKNKPTPTRRFFAIVKKPSA